MRYIWLVFIVLSALLEVLNKRLWAFSFISGAIAAMVLAFCGAKPWIQWLVFGIISAVLLLLLKGILRLPPKKSVESFAIENTVGMKCAVVERIDNVAGRGAVLINGYEWAARMLSDACIVEAGAKVEIIAVEGVKLICRKV